MGYFEQSPELKHSGEKFQSPYHWGKAIRTHELEAAINNCLGGKEFAMAKIMYFLTGNAEGFRVSEKTICERCNISESGYKNARKKLVKKGWLFHKPGEYIQVNYNKVFSDYRALKTPRASQDTAPKDEKIPVRIVSIREPDSSKTPPGVSDDSEKWLSEDTHNNINNNINDTINKNISEENSIKRNCEDTPSAASGVSSQPLRGRYHSEEEKRKARQQYEAWFFTQQDKIVAKYDQNDYAAVRKMYQSEEYKAFQKEAEEKQKALEEEYGKLFKH